MDPLLRNWLALTILAAALAGCGEHASEGTDCPVAERSKTVSGFCVPRWVSLKHGEVMGRKGPGKDYPAQWVYRVKGLPVQVVGETEEWRRVCDPDGGAVWVHRSEIDGRRMIMSLASTPAAMRRSPVATAPAVGLLNARALAALGACKGDWCKVKAGGVTGWLSTDQVWGLVPAAQCR
ncbi:MAG TPA: SH3 domain-containing protein [Caulobacteraceae bacterium]|jgi:SH3-like domain-containing protein